MATAWQIVQDSDGSYWLARLRDGEVRWLAAFDPDASETDRNEIRDKLNSVELVNWHETAEVR